MQFFKMNIDRYYAKNAYVSENVFLHQIAEKNVLPVYEDIKLQLPQPIWSGHEDVIACYYRAWEIAFGNLRPANNEARIVSNFIDTAFNGQLFMWDSSFIVMFGKYAMHIFNFQKTLDNFYSHQHQDGFICRQLCETEEGARFSRDDPCSTGPNILPWAEWEYYCTTNDIDRLGKVFAPLCGYHRWLQLNRSWPNGGYWTTGLGCGMDNQPRLSNGYDVLCSHGFMTWIDVCAQQYFSADILIKMAKVLGREKDVEWLKEERELLKNLINENMWDEETSFYYDVYRDGKRSTTKTVGAYWTMIAGLVSKERAGRFVAHLDNEKEFKRPCRVPSLSADHPQYEKLGGYWKGGVWAPTNYMVLKGLDRYGYNDLAHEIACNYLENVVSVFNNDCTLYENYAPELPHKGDPAGKEFVGWTGLAPISILFEYVFGIRPDATNKKITWYVNLTERHGVKRYPLGDIFVDLICEKRSSVKEKPNIVVNSPVNIIVEVVWDGGRRSVGVGE